MSQILTEKMSTGVQMFAMNNVKSSYAKKALLIYFFAAILLGITFRAHSAEKESKDEKSTTKKKSAKKEKEMIAVIETNMGTIKAKLFTDLAPNTAANFAGLASGTKEYTDPKTGKKTKGHFYDGVKFHRIIKGFMIQGGDPIGNGTGGPGYEFKNEIGKGLTHKPGILSMANAGPDTNGSQFFIMVGNHARLDGSYSIFGEVTEGMDVVDAISKVRTGPNDRPIEDVVMKTVRIINN
jgi:peptidyl-prolyl cis-trans isomerase A (cyclophilin A)